MKASSETRVARMRLQTYDAAIGEELDAMTLVIGVPEAFVEAFAEQAIKHANRKVRVEMTSLNIEAQSGGVN